MATSLLPTKAFKPRLNPSTWMVTAHGAPGSGKSTFLSSIPDCLILDFEKSTKGLSCLAVDIVGVEGVAEQSSDPNDRPRMTLKQAYAEIVQSKHAFKTVAIDTMSSLWECWAAEYRRINKVENEETVKFAEGTKWVARKCKDFINSLRNMGYGVFIAAHTSINKEGVHHVSCHKRIDSWLNQESDQILYYKIVDGGEGEASHIIQTHGSWDAHAEDRLGVLPKTLNNNFCEYIAAIEAAQAKESQG